MPQLSPIATVREASISTFVLFQQNLKLRFQAAYLSEAFICLQILWVVESSIEIFCGC